MLTHARDAREATMADDNKGASNAKADAARAESAAKADVRAVSQDEVRVDASEHLSYKDYAAQFKKPIVTVQRLIERKGLPKPKLRSFVPNFEVKQVMKWGELPKEEPAKPERAAATVRSYILHVPPARKPPPPGIGSIEPPGKG